tara:strand:- start:23 stop:157 length:135 start_codon:yes stop_codon:yes gene_type:complete
MNDQNFPSLHEIYLQYKISKPQKSEIADAARLLMKIVDRIKHFE